MFNHWLFRVAVVSGLTYAAVRYLPLNAAGRVVALAIGGVSAAGIVGANVPLAGQLMSGQLPMLPAPAAGTEV